MRLIFLVLMCFSFVASASAGEADIVKAEAIQTSPGVWTVKVTVRHDDAGWDHYANRWEILDLERNILATRVLAHPHDNEQPFTRSLTGVLIPLEMRQVIVRAHDSVHGYGGKEFRLTLKK